MSGARIRVVDPNPLITVQDAGRRGAMRFGVSESGPMDWVRYRLAGRLVEAPAAIEVGLGGARIAAEGTVRVAVTGPGFTVKVGETTLTPPARLTIPDGEVMTITPGRTGMWAYVTVEGIDFGPPVLGSYATNARTGFGRRDLAAGFACAAVNATAPELFDDPYDDTGPVAVLPGPQQHMFPPAIRERFASEPFRLSPALDRMGYTLEGPRVEAISHDIVSDGIVEGAMQVPGNGQPIVQLADRAPTGGYPKICVIAAADRPRLAQRRPHEEVRFRWIDIEEAGRRRRALMDAIAHPAPRIRREFDPEILARVNLVGGVWGHPEHTG
ncbi:urea amidolyase [Acuticoccus sediminis]|uniref:Urea amidolyase n=1 Tax=Acuticoccus sediminis TaxID=2184697 RepID=A0A8B2NU73_9HYPH|nr:biotin-dependent carboxyltransferase family protein [Acuticoccus sediminis]RAI03748.1 urea amidolyase [Acuticoccus sediminis]